MSLETCPTCGKFMSKKELDYSLSHFGNKSCKACDKQKYTVSSDGPQKRKVSSTTVSVSDEHSYESKLNLDTTHSDSPVLAAFGKTFFDASPELQKLVGHNSQSFSNTNTSEKNKIDAQISSFSSKDIGLLIGAIFAFFVPGIGPILAIILFAIWRAKSMNKKP